MIELHTLTVRNFLSVGNNTQSVNFNGADLWLVLGENLDQGGDDAGARNGTGKTTIMNALSYALYDKPLTKIKISNLVNKTNNKNLVVSVEFTHNGKRHRIERGHKPKFLKYFVENEEQEDQDEAQGSSRLTIEDMIANTLKMPHVMFQHLVALNTYTTPFLSMSAGDQREIIEHLLGITILSEKADKLRKEVKHTKDLVTGEEAKTEAQKAANEKILQTIENIKAKQKRWAEDKEAKLADLALKLDDLSQIDIEAELAAHTALEEWKEHSAEVEAIKKEIAGLEREYERHEKSAAKAHKDLESAKENKCPTCEQELHDNTLLERLEQEHDEAQAEMKTVGETVEALTIALDKIPEVGEKPTTHYKTVGEAHEHNNKVTRVTEQIVAADEETDPYEDQIKELQQEALVEINYQPLEDLLFVREHQDFLLKLLTDKGSYVRKKIIDQNLLFLNNRLKHYLDEIGLPHRVTFQNDLNVEITHFGNELDFDNLSRGERNRLILSMSWAFRDMWENLYEPINLLFVDELIDSGMDSSGVDDSMKILNHFAHERGKSVWLVSHKDDLRLKVNNVLTVIKQNGYTSYAPSN